MENVVSAHKINSTNEFTFDPSVYSKFKYGCAASAVAMAEEMVVSFLDYDKKYNLIDEDTEIVIVPSAYRTVPSAATFLADNIRLMLNWHFHNKGLKPVTTTKMHRETSYEGDYGKLPVNERKEVLSKESLSMHPRSISGKIVLFVDDIRVTGTHELLIEDMMDKHANYAAYNYIYLYYAITTPDLPPHIEDMLNKFGVRGPLEMAAIFGERHHLSARMIKDILRLDMEDLNTFLIATTPYKSDHINVDLVINLVNNSIAEGFDKLPSFKNNFNYLKNIVKHELNKSKETASYQS